MGDGARAIHVADGGTYIENQVIHIEQEQPVDAGFFVPFARHKKFVGRQGYLDDLHRYLMADPLQPIGLVGLGGSGKTQLAVEYLYRHQDQYTAGIFWLNGATF